MPDPDPNRYAGNGGARPMVREDDGRREGRSGPHTPTRESRELVSQLSAVFPDNRLHYIAQQLGISVSTLRRQYQPEIDSGRAKLLIAVGSGIIRLAMDGDAKGPDGKPIVKGNHEMMRFIMARLGGWAQNLEITPVGTGSAEHIDLSRLNADQLETYGRLSAIAAGVDPDSIVAVPR